MKKKSFNLQNFGIESNKNSIFALLVIENSSNISWINRALAMTIFFSTTARGLENGNADVIAKNANVRWQLHWQWNGYRALLTQLLAAEEIGTRWVVVVWGRVGTCAVYIASQPLGVCIVSVLRPK